MEQYTYDKEKLYEATNRGLDIIHKYCPDSVGNEKQKNKKFRLRSKNDDKTPSASIYLNKKSNLWHVNDFGDNNYNPISLVMYLRGLDFYEALKMLYAEFTVGENTTIYKANLDFKENTDNLPSSFFEINPKKKFENLHYYGNYVTEEIAKLYNVVEVESYKRITSTGKLMTTKCTEHYPIFAYSPDIKKWAKLYQPAEFKRKDKNGNEINYKHGYVGTPDKDYIHGLDRILKIAKEKDIEVYSKELEKAETKIDKNHFRELISDLQVPNVILCSGASDGLNVAGLSTDFYPIWLNSEGAMLTAKQYQRIKKLCKNFYNLPDIDTAGLQYANKVANTFWNIGTIMLPKQEMSLNGKDFRDWLRNNSHKEKETILWKFKQLMKGASLCNFFTRTKEGKPAIEVDDLHYFLNTNGYFRYYDKSITNEENIDTSKIVKVVNNVVSIPQEMEIKDFVKQYVRVRDGEKAKSSLIKKTPFLRLESLKAMNKKTLDFTDYTENSQIFFFKNGFVEATDKEIKFTSYGQAKKQKKQIFVWENKVNKHSFFLDKEKYFAIYKDAKNENRVKINTTKCEFMNYLINASRVFWQTEMSESAQQQKHKTFNINSDKLSEKENLIQEHHFLNKVWAIGYMCHSHKVESLAKFVYIIDDAIKGMSSDADGGTGKSFMIRGLREILKIMFSDGRQEISDDKHFLAGVDSSYDLVYLEDLNDRKALSSLYNKITNDMEVNPKSKQKYSISFKESPKLVGTFNYLFDDGTGSTARRVFYVAFGNYYHSAKRGGFKHNYKIADDFAGDLFSNRWTTSDWSCFFNFIMQCTHFYLQNIDNPFYAPMENIEVNSLKSQIGDDLIEWLDDYFTDASKLNEKIYASFMLKEYKLLGSKIGASLFMRKLKLYSELRGYDFCPKELCSKPDYIRMTFTDDTGKYRDGRAYYFGTKESCTKIIEEQKNKEIYKELDTSGLTF